MGLIAVAGHICVDISPALPSGIPAEPGSLVQVGPVRLSLGGCVGNTAVRLAELGAHVSVAATVGTDDLGAVVRSSLLRAGLEDSGIRSTTEADTAYSLILESPGTDRVIWHYPGANEFFDDELVSLSEASLVHLGYPSLLPGMLTDNELRLRRLLSRARDAGATTSVDLAVIDRRSDIAELDWASVFSRVLPLVDVLSPSFDDIASALPSLPAFSRSAVEGAAAQLLRSGVAVVMVSAGEHGMYVMTAPEDRIRGAGKALRTVAREWSNLAYWQNPVAVEQVRSTNGAGDAATAGLLAGIDFGLDPMDATWLAAASASASISRSPLGGLLTGANAPATARAASA